MQTYRVSDEFALGADAFWDMFWSEDYCQKLNDAIELKWELLELEFQGEGDDRTAKRVQRLTPKREVPKLMKKFVDGAIAYTEHNTWRRGDNLLVCKTVPNFMADKITSEGDYIVEPLGPDRVRRVYEGKIECRVPLVGGKVEKMLVDEIRESYKRAGDFTHKYIEQLKQA